MNHVRPYTPADHAFVLSLAPRLTIGMPRWRDPQQCLAAIEACEQWARAEDYRVLTLATGAANTQALGFYHHLGYRDEDVVLIKLLNDAEERA